MKGSAAVLPQRATQMYKRTLSKSLRLRSNSVRTRNSQLAQLTHRLGCRPAGSATKLISRAIRRGRVVRNSVPVGGCAGQRDHARCKNKRNLCSLGLHLHEASLARLQMLPPHRQSRATETLPCRHTRQQELQIHHFS